MTEKLPRIVFLRAFLDEFETKLLLAIAVKKHSINAIRNLTPYLLLLIMLSLILCWHYVLSGLVCSVNLISVFLEVWVRLYQFDLYLFFYLVKLII